MLEVTVTAMGDGLGICLPDDVVQKLKIGEGDPLLLVPQAGGYLLLPAESELAAQLKVAEEVVHRYHNALRELAD
jgi:putative addiction module antidote